MTDVQHTERGADNVTVLPIENSLGETLCVGLSPCEIRQSHSQIFFNWFYEIGDHTTVSGGEGVWIWRSRVDIQLAQYYVVAF